MKKIEFVSYLDSLELNRIRVRLATENGELKDRWEWYRERYIKKLKKK